MSYFPRDIVCNFFLFFIFFGKPRLVLKASDAKHQTNVITSFINVCMMKNTRGYYGVN